MANYLFIASRDPYESCDAQHFLDLVEGVRARTHRTTLYLVQNGVLGARAGAQHSGLYQRLAQAGVAVIADSFSLRERAIGKVAAGVTVSDMNQLVDLLVEPGTKALWH